MTNVDNAHSKVIDAIEALSDVSIGELNETEREYVVDALDTLYLADAALAERSTFPPTDDARVTTTAD